VKPRLLDLFAGAGGCTAGYMAAGFEVTAVDLNERALARNPAPRRMVADAMAVLRGEVEAVRLGAFDVIHASPPCQAYSITKNAHTVKHPDLVPETLTLLREWQARTDGAWVVENVVGAPLPDAVTLCGSMFDLVADDHYIGAPVRLQRHRLFASSAFILAPGPCRHDRSMRVGGVYGGAWSKNRTLDPTVKRTGGYAPPDDVQRALMGIDWMTRQQLNQAIPPVYAEWVGRQLLTSMAVAAVKRDLEAEANTRSWSDFLARWSERRAAERRSDDETATPHATTPRRPSSGHQLAKGGRNRGRRTSAVART
jgi:DNA (cytosine-5)-methyltransferase 1